MSAMYWLGVATIPALAAIVYGALITITYVSTHWRRWRPNFTRDMERRADYAAAITVAHRLISVPVIGGTILWYGTVDPTDNRWKRARSHVRNGLVRATQDAQVIR